MEAMRFDVPVFAYATAAVAETLGPGGVLFREKNPVVIAEAIGLLASHPKARQQVLACQRARAAELSPGQVSPRWKRFLEFA